MPDRPSVAIGEKVTFTVEGLDQYGSSVGLEAVAWEATAGVIDEHGVYTAGEEAGSFIVRASAAGIEGVAQVRVTSRDRDSDVGADDSGERPAGKALLRWSGQIPPQKWMNFYTKVVSRYASDPNLRLTVGFEVPVESDESSSREQDARTALRELGLNEDASVL